MMGILNGKPVQLDLGTILHTYMRHRESVIERRTQFELDKAEARAHILEGLMKRAEENGGDYRSRSGIRNRRDQFEAVPPRRREVPEDQALRLLRRSRPRQLLSAACTS